MAEDFRNLKIWQKGYELLNRVYDITLEYPQEEKFGLTDQIRRSANGVMASIAEAYGRYYFADKARTLYFSRGECYETQSHLSVSKSRGYIDDKTFLELDEEYGVLAKGINAYIRSLKSRVKNKK